MTRVIGDERYIRFDAGFQTNITESGTQGDTSMVSLEAPTELGLA